MMAWVYMLWLMKTAKCIYFLRGREYHYIRQYKTVLDGYNQSFTTSSTLEKDESILKRSDNIHTIKRMKQSIEKMSAPIFPRPKSGKHN